MRFLGSTCALVLAVSVGGALAVRADDAANDSQPDAAVAAFRADVAPLLAKYCSDCHAGEEPTGGLPFDDYLKRSDVAQDRETWEKIARKLHDREMPPEDEPQPDGAERDKITSWIDDQLDRYGCGPGRDPGRVTIRRLNRNEYNNTIRDLLGVDFQPADDFPSDDVGYGFDNIGDVLSMPTILLEKYLAAAEEIAARALGTEQVNQVTGEIVGGQIVDDGARIISSSEVELRHQAPPLRQGRVPVARQSLGRSGRRRAGADGRVSQQAADPAL